MVEITPAGLAVLAELRPLVHANEKAWMGALSDVELGAYIDLLHRIQASLDTGP